MPVIPASPPPGAAPPPESISEPNLSAASHLEEHAKGYTVVESPEECMTQSNEPVGGLKARMGLQYTSTSQVVLQLPLLVAVVLIVVSLFLKVQMNSLRVPVVLSTLSSWTNCIFLSLPFQLTILYYAAALHAREVAHTITNQALRERKITAWSDQDLTTAKMEGSKLGVTAFSVYIVLPLACVLAFVGVVHNAGSISANGARLAMTALGIIAFYAIVVCSVHVLIRGLLRRERDSSVNYITFTLEPMLLVLIAFQLFLTSFGVLILLTVPSSPGTNILLSAGTFSSEVFIYPTFDECKAHVNQTYFDQHCERTESNLLPWQQFGGGLDIKCNDGGWGVFDSLFSACRSLVAENVAKDPVGNNLFSQLFVGGLVLVKEYLASADPSINISNFMRKGSLFLRTAIFCALVVAVCAAPLVAHAFYLSTGQGSLAPWFAYSARLLGAFSLASSLVMIFVHFLVSKFTAVHTTTFFISYKQDDQSDGAVSMLFTNLPGEGHWLDKMQDDRSVKGMLKGVQESDAFLAVISPRYFTSWFCCLELHTAMTLGKPIQLVFNAHKMTVRMILDIVNQIPELSPLKDIEILPIHEEIQMIRPCVERLMEAVHSGRLIAVFGKGKNGEGKDRATEIPKRIGQHTFDQDEPAEKLAEKAKMFTEVDVEEANGQNARKTSLAAVRLERHHTIEMVDDHEMRVRELEAKFNNLFTRKGGYEFLQSVNGC